jgi:hypothetical protein
MAGLLNTVIFASAIATTFAEGPCDIFDAAKEDTPCVAAHSTVRALYANYSVGSLFAAQTMCL